jgi:hypothetical protein
MLLSSYPYPFSHIHKLIYYLGKSLAIDYFSELVVRALKNSEWMLDSPRELFGQWNSKVLVNASICIY